MDADGRQTVCRRRRMSSIRSLSCSLRFFRVTSSTCSGSGGRLDAQLVQPFVQLVVLRGELRGTLRRSCSSLPKSLASCGHARLLGRMRDIGVRVPVRRQCNTARPQGSSMPSGLAGGPSRRWSKRRATEPARPRPAGVILLADAANGEAQAFVQLCARPRWSAGLRASLSPRQPHGLSGRASAAATPCPAAANSGCTARVLMCSSSKIDPDGAVGHDRAARSRRASRRRGSTSRVLRPRGGYISRVARIGEATRFEGEDASRSSFELAAARWSTRHVASGVTARASHRADGVALAAVATVARRAPRPGGGRRAARWRAAASRAPDARCAIRAIVAASGTVSSSCVDAGSAASTHHARGHARRR